MLNLFVPKGATVTQEGRDIMVILSQGAEKPVERPEEAPGSDQPAPDGEDILGAEADPNRI